ncbi:MAG: hypothetical protein R2716_12230 [Microthrixaceae bacterium]
MGPDRLLGHPVLPLLVLFALGGPLPMGNVPTPMGEDSRSGISWWTIATLAVIVGVAVVSLAVATIRRRRRDR